MKNEDILMLQTDGVHARLVVTNPSRTVQSRVIQVIITDLLED